jgi:DhnA family fructose-bisphosphate aldolase class Ia
LTLTDHSAEVRERLWRYCDTVAASSTVAQTVTVRWRESEGDVVTEREMTSAVLDNDWTGAPLRPRDELWLERASYVRGPTGLARVYVVNARGDDSTRREALNSVVRDGGDREMVLMITVLPRAVALRRSARRTHSRLVTVTAMRALGFRSGAAAEADIARLHQREAEVAAGRALSEVDVLVAQYASTLRELRRRGRELADEFASLGVSVDGGALRQGTLFATLVRGAP